MDRSCVPALALTCALTWPALVSAHESGEGVPLGIRENFELREIGATDSGLSISPDGRVAVFIERETRSVSDDYRHVVMLSDISSGRTRALAEAGGFIFYINSAGLRQGSAAIRRPVFSPSGRWIAFLFGDHDAVYADIVDAHTGARVQRVDAPGDIKRFAWTEAGGLILEMETARSTLAADAVRLNRSGFVVDSRLNAQMGLIPLPDVARERSFIVLDPSTGARRNATPEEEALLVGARSSWPTGRSRESLPNSAGARAALRAEDAIAGAAAPPLTLAYEDAAETIRCNDPVCAGASGPWISSEGRIYFQRAEPPARVMSAIYEWMPRSNVVRRVRTAEDLLSGCEIAQTELVCFRDATLEPRRLVAINLSSGMMRTVYQPNPTWPGFRLTRAERIDVEDQFGNAAFGHLVYPASFSQRQRYPLVIVQYRSRGFLRGGVGGEYPIHALAQRGYFVLSVERPQHVADRTRQGQSAAQWQEELEDLERRSKLSALYALIDRALANAPIDSDRIGITGMSDGAETAYWALMDGRRSFAAAVVSTPPLDPIVYSLASDDFTERLRRLHGRSGPWPDAPEPWASHWRTKPAVFHVETIQTPILLQLADREALPAFPFYRRMREHKRAIEMVIYPDAYHSKTRPGHLLAAQLRAIAWLDFWLQNTNVADPTDPTRASRWQTMRETRSSNVIDPR